MSNLKIITEPSVFLVGQSQVNEAELARFLESEDVAGWTTDTLVGGERLVEVAGRTCYMSFAKPRPGGNKGYLDHILDVAHGSVLEHSCFNLLITGVSRSLTHERVRHRHDSYSQLSQRYVDESDASFVVPPLIQIKPGVTLDLNCISEDEFESRYDYMAFLEWRESVEESKSHYKKLTKILKAKLESRPNVCPVCADGRLNISNGWCPTCEDYTCPTIQTDNRKAAREAARSVLPSATETKIFVTGNARSWRHFIELRGSRHADAEIKRLALKVLKVLNAASPNLFSDYLIEPFDDGSFEITSKHPKV